MINVHNDKLKTYKGCLCGGIFIFKIFTLITRETRFLGWAFPRQKSGSRFKLPRALAYVTPSHCPQDVTISTSLGSTLLIATERSATSNC